MSSEDIYFTYIYSAMCRESLRHNKALPLSWNGSRPFSAGVTQPSSLLRTHVPNLLSLLASVIKPCAFNLCRLLQAPADNRSFPALSLSTFRRCLIPYPGALWSAFSHFYLQSIGLLQANNGSANAIICAATFSTEGITGLQIFSNV